MWNNSQWEQENQEFYENEKKDILLIDCMREIPDLRIPYNQRHKFLDVIIIAATAVLAGMDTWNEIADWAASKKEWLETFLELPGGMIKLRISLTAELKFLTYLYVPPFRF